MVTKNVTKFFTVFVKVLKEAWKNLVYFYCHSFIGKVLFQEYKYEMSGFLPATSFQVFLLCPLNDLK